MEKAQFRGFSMNFKKKESNGVQHLEGTKLIFFHLQAFLNSSFFYWKYKKFNVEVDH